MQVVYVIAKYDFANFFAIVIGCEEGWTFNFNAILKLKDATKKKRKEPQLQQINTQINGLYQRIRYSETDYENTRSRSIAEIHADIEKLEQRLELFAPELDEIEVRIGGRSEKLNTLRAEHEKVEDEIFARFCEDIGVENIRAYEEKELHKPGFEISG